MRKKPSHKIRELAKGNTKRDRQKNAWRKEWPNGTLIGETTSSRLIMAVSTARKLGHPVVVTANESGISFIALPR